MKHDARLHLGRLVNGPIAPRFASRFKPALRKQGTAIKVKIDMAATTAATCAGRLRRGCISTLETIRSTRARTHHPEAAPVSKTDARHTRQATHAGPEPSTVPGGTCQLRIFNPLSGLLFLRESSRGRGPGIDRSPERVAVFDTNIGMGPTTHPHITPLFPSNPH